MPKRIGTCRGRPARAGLHPWRAQIVAGVEDQFVLAGAEFVARQQRRVAAAVGIGHDGLQQRSARRRSMR